MKALLIALFLLYPKFDIALSSWGLYIAFNDASDPTQTKAMKSYLDKTLLVRGWYGGQHAHYNSIILELTPGTEHKGVEYVVAKMNDLTDVIRANKKFDQPITVLCRENGFETLTYGNKKVNQPLLTDCELIK